MKGVVNLVVGKVLGGLGEGKMGEWSLGSVWSQWWGEGVGWRRTGVWGVDRDRGASTGERGRWWMVNSTLCEERQGW